MANPDLRPPVALLVYVPDQPRKAAYYPFAEFSPEWQAIRYGLTNGIPVSFMDLPQAYQLAAEGLPADPGPVSDDALLVQRTQDPLTWLAETAGYSDGERWWEHMVEQRRSGGQDLFAGIQEMITTLRAEAEQVGKEILKPASPFEAPREAFMRQTIRAAQAEGYQKIAVVCGAWHTPALANLHPAEEDARLIEGLAKIKVAAAWVPWSYGHLSWASGYGAGIESPGWYDALWQAAQENLSSTDVTIRWMTLVAHLLRGEDLSASSAHVIEAVRLAETLAALRGRPVPGLPELNEAVQAVFCFGDALPLLLIHEKLIVSERLGRVPDDAPMTPLQSDLAQQQKRLRLSPEASSRDLERSYLLHRLDLLEIPWGTAQHVSGKSGTFHELWRLQWRPELAVKVVEASQWGNSVNAAAAAFIQHAAQHEAVDLPGLTALVSRALLADLPSAVEALMARLDAEAALTSDMGQLMDALPALAEVLRYGNVRQTDTQMIARVVDGLVARICIGLPAACASLNDEAAVAMFARINRVRGALLIHEDTLWRVIDEWVTGLSGDVFIQFLPLLRRTFSTFAAPERRMLGERAKQGTAPRVRQEQTAENFDIRSAEAVLPLLARLLGIALDGGKPG